MRGLCGAQQPSALFLTLFATACLAFLPCLAPGALARGALFLSLGAALRRGRQAVSVSSAAAEQPQGGE